MCFALPTLFSQKKSKDDLGKCTMFILLLLYTYTLPCCENIADCENQSTTRGQQDFGFACVFWPAEFTTV